ncbi:hypothetical protein K7432_008484 [Basidiobolus ranarum]|uniref:Cyclin N-terminal domain-containing protein n=1 Tax=Basidiobolus ranarum TaxID=34480 RepID=A0ABR2VYJ1_9FUNG
MSLAHLIHSLSQPSRYIDQIQAQYPRYSNPVIPPNEYTGYSTNPSCIPKPLIPDNSNYLGDVAANIIYFIWYSNPNPFSLPTYPTFRVFCIHVLNNIRMSPATVILALKYVQKLKKMSQTMRGESGSEYRIFIVAMILASKFLEDITYTSQSWSTITGMPTREIAIMEREFLAGLQYELYVSNSDFLLWFQTIQTYCLNQQQWLRRSNLSRASSGNSLLLTQAYQPYEWPQINAIYYPPGNQVISTATSYDYPITDSCVSDDTSTPFWY